VEVYTDGYAYDPVSMSLHLVSLAGNDSAVKAVSAAIVSHREVNIHCEGKAALDLSAHCGITYRILSVKLDCGAVHQIVADERFFHPSDRGDHLLIVPPEGELPEVVYRRVLSHVASPVIPEWAEWICSRLSEDRHLKELEGTVKVVEVSAEEFVLDELVAEGLEQNQIELSDTGGIHAGLNQ
jgi:hypothetical protein